MDVLVGSWWEKGKGRLFNKDLTQMEEDALWCHNPGLSPNSVGR